MCKRKHKNIDNLPLFLIQILLFTNCFVKPNLKTISGVFELLGLIIMFAGMLAFFILSRETTKR
ncbi:hypothetical protein [Clostridium thailandense]|uniref:hypothetical protein n=1 Tax=Clostridium thailandense TaxID=2794346 RepID=UPI003988A486